MAVWNVKDNKEEIDEIAWAGSEYWNLVSREEGVFFKSIK